MKTWIENGYEMVKEDGVIYVLFGEYKDVFVKWWIDSSGNYVPVIKLEMVEKSS